MGVPANLNTGEKSKIDSLSFYYDTRKQSPPMNGGPWYSSSTICLIFSNVHPIDDIRDRLVQDIPRKSSIENIIS